MSTQFDDISEWITTKYDPKRDIPPSGPTVTIADFQLFQLIRILHAEVKALREELEATNARANRPNRV